jgi:hypothetical protein
MERSPYVPAPAVASWVLLEAAAFLALALLRLGVDLDFGWLEPRIVPAFLVALGCAVLLAGAGAALLGRRRDARTLAAAAQVGALCGILIGWIAHRIGREPLPPESDLFEWALLGALVFGVALTLARPLRLRVGARGRRAAGETPLPASR